MTGNPSTSHAIRPEGLQAGKYIIVLKKLVFLANFFAKNQLYQQIEVRIQESE